MKTMYLILGAIGSGKSTLAESLGSKLNIDFISSDLYKKVYFNNYANLSTGYRKADLLVKFKLNMNCKNYISFIYELCPSNAEKILTITELKKKYSYRLITFIIGTDSSQVNIRRTLKRIQVENADFVAVEKVASRYDLTFENLPQLINISEENYFIDNTDFYKVVGYMKEKKLHLFGKTNWLSDLLIKKINN